MNTPAALERGKSRIPRSGYAGLAFGRSVKTLRGGQDAHTHAGGRPGDPRDLEGRPLDGRGGGGDGERPLPRRRPDPHAPGTSATRPRAPRRRPARVAERAPRAPARAERRPRRGPAHEGARAGDSPALRGAGGADPRARAANGAAPGGAQPKPRMNFASSDMRSGVHGGSNV